MNVQLILSLLLLLLLLPPIFAEAICTHGAEDFDFFYFVQQWPGSYCDTRRSCCYPKEGKPAADFAIHGLWPNYNSGDFPSNCDPDSIFDAAQIRDLIDSLKKNWPNLACLSSEGYHLWEYEWEKHGTCSESILDEHSYFQAALELKNKTNLLQILKDAGIQPDGEYYQMASINNAIKEATGFTPSVVCNVDEARNAQLYQVYMCVDTSGSRLIECPVFPGGRSCPTNRIEFPVF